MTLTVTKPQPGEVEQRGAPEGGELAVEGNRVTGLIPYSTLSRDLGGFREQIAPGAFEGTELHDLVATVNHDPSRLLGRFDNTLQVEARSQGLAWSVELPNGPLGQDVKESVRRGDLNQSSWRFVCGKDRWSGSTRIIEEVRELKDVSLVTTAAYGPDATAVELRQQPNTPPAPPENQEEDEVNDREEKPRAGGLVVEDRRADENADIETRLVDALRGVPQGEVRSLTLESAAPVEPDDLSTFVFDALRPQSVLLSSGVPVVTTRRKSWKAPTIVGDVEADWYAELEQIEASDPELSELEITPRKVAALVKGSSEAFSDSDPDLLSLVQDNLATALATKIDSEGFAGNSEKGFKGLSTMSGTQSLDMAEAALENYDALVAAVALLAEAEVPGPYAIAMHPRHAASLDRLRALGVVAGEVGPELVKLNAPLGRPAGLPPIYVTPHVGFTAAAGEKVDRAPIVVYAPGMLRLARRMETELVVDRSKEVDYDAVLVRGIARCALGTAYPESVVIVKDVSAPAIEL